MKKQEIKDDFQTKKDADCQTVIDFLSAISEKADESFEETVRFCTNSDEAVAWAMTNGKTEGCLAKKS